MSKESTVTRGQLFFMIMKFEIGVDILSLPYRIHLIAKGGGWISVLIGGMLIQLIILLCWLLLRRFPNSSIYQIMMRITGRWIGAILVIAYAAYYLLMGTSVLVNAYDVINRWMLQNTPRWAILVLFMFTSIYLVRQNLRTIARVLVLISFLIAPMMLLISYGIMQTNLLYLLPLTEAGWPQIISASTESLMAMFGFEFFLVVLPLVQGTSKSKLGTITAASAVVSLLYGFTVFICSTAFSPQQLSMMPEPVIYLLRSIPLGTMDRADFCFCPFGSSPSLVPSAAIIMQLRMELPICASSKATRMWSPSLFWLRVSSLPCRSGRKIWRPLAPSPTSLPIIFLLFCRCCC